MFQRFFYGHRFFNLHTLVSFKYSAVFLFDFDGFGKPDDTLDFFPSFLHFFEPFFRRKPKGVSFFGKAQVGVVLTESQTIFRARRHHTIRLVRAFCDKVVDKHAYVRFVAV